MADVQTSFTMTTTSTFGKKSTKSVTNISENATNGEIITLANALNNVTTNVMNGISKVQKTDLNGQYPSSDSLIQMEADGTEGAITINGRKVTVNVTKITQDNNEFLYIERTDGAENYDIDLSNVKIMGQNASDYAFKIIFSIMTSAMHICFQKPLGTTIFPSYKIIFTNLSHNGVEYSDYTLDIEVISQA